MVATATDEASMETSSAEAPTTDEKQTQTEPRLLEVPRLSGKTRPKGELIPLDRYAFGFKRNFTIRKRIDIYGPHGSATRAKNRAVSSMISSIINPKLTSHQIVFALREASVHPIARLFFKSAGLIDCEELDTLKHMISNCDKFLGKALKSGGVTKGRVSDEQSEMAHALFLAFSDSPQDLDSDDEQRKNSPSKRQRLSLLPSVPTRMGHRKFK